MNIDLIHRLLAVADPSRDPYAVGQIAIALLTANPKDGPARAHFARALTELNLLAAAQNLLGAAVDSPTGILAWPSRARRFAANLRALESKDSLGAALVKDAAAELARYQLHQCADGNFQILDQQLPIHACWLANFENHKAATGLWQFDAAKAPIPAPIVFQGLGFGWLFLHILARTEKTFINYSCAAHILEGDPLAVAMVFHMHDFQAAIRHPRTHWYIRATSEAALEGLREKLARDKSLTLPQQFIRAAIRPAPPLPLERTIQQLAAERKEHRRERVGHNARHYANKEAAFWAGRFDDALSQRSEKLRILAITSRHTTVLQYSMAEMQSAIESHFAGTCEVKLAIEPDDSSFENPFVELIAEFEPDLIFQISRLRYENSDLPRNIPFLCWDQDNLPCMRTKEATAALDPLTYIAGHGAVVGFTTLNWPRENCIFVHPAGATFRYHPAPVGTGVLAQHACDMSYVSNASGSPASLAGQTAARWSGHPEWLAVFEEVAQFIAAESENGAAWEYVGLRNLVRAAAKKRRLAIDGDVCRALVSDIATYADRCFRHATLGWAARWCDANARTFRLYGRGWEQHPDFAKHAAGIAEPGDHARAIYQATKINLQLIEPGFIHSRALDGLAAGGFFLARKTPADGLGSEPVKTQYALARWTVENDIGSDAELHAVSDPRIQAMIAVTQKYYDDHEITEPMWRSLQIWAETPPAAMLFPQLPAITFHNEQTFGDLAAKYLADDAARGRLATDMRRLVEERFSYSARWRDFLGSVRDGLANHARGTGFSRCESNQDIACAANFVPAETR